MKAFQFCMVFIGLLAYVVALDLESSQQRQGGHPGPDTGQVFKDLFLYCLLLFQSKPSFTRSKICRMILI